VAQPRAIGIDASRLTVGRLTGTETYTYQLLRAIARLAPPDEFDIYLNTDRPPADMSLPGRPVCIPFPRFWTHLRLSAEMILRRPGTLFVPAHVVPLIHPPTVVTIHDLGYLSHPESHPASALRMLDWTTRWSVRVAKRMIAISNATKLDLIRHYRVPADTIDVVHHGVAPEFRPATRGEIERIRTRYRLPERYLLAVGTVQPRKNYGRLAAAVAALNRDDVDFTLAIAGKPGWMFDQVEREIAASGAGDRVRLLGYVEDRDLPALYSGASVYCQPSLYEGFGMPVLEAMACGVPVLAANTSALPEVGGEAALYHDPLDPAAIADGLRRLIGDSELRTELTIKGATRSAEFTWERCAGQTVEILRRVRDA
jgi:glycosyltransferase involved in cell wall biosynthesis